MAKTRKIMFTDEQMLIARDSGKFKDHRKFVEFLFKKQCRCKVENHLKLRYHHETKGTVCITTVEGDLGHALVQY